MRKIQLELGFKTKILLWLLIVGLFFNAAVTIFKPDTVRAGEEDKIPWPTVKPDILAKVWGANWKGYEVREDIFGDVTLSVYDGELKDKDYLSDSNKNWEGINGTIKGQVSGTLRHNLKFLPVPAEHNLEKVGEFNQ